MPAGQAVHGVLEAPASLNVPAAHTVCVDDASGQYEPAGQVMHKFAVALVAEEYVPAAQFCRAVIPFSLQNVPAGHGLHTDGSDPDVV